MLQASEEVFREERIVTRDATAGSGLVLDRNIHTFLYVCQ